MQLDVPQTRRRQRDSASSEVSLKRRAKRVARGKKANENGGVHGLPYESTVDPEVRQDELAPGPSSLRRTRSRKGSLATDVLLKKCLGEVASASSKSSLSSQDLSQETATIASDEVAAISSDMSQDTGNSQGSVRTVPSVLLREFSIVNRKVSSLHEHVSPIYTMREREAFGINEEYGGITGTLRPSCFERLARFLRGEIIKGARVFVSSESADVPPALNAAYQLKKTSVFCDIGSGTGRPAFYFACLPIRASVGFDVDPMQVLNSLHAQRLLHRVEATSSLQRAPTCFFHENVLTLTSLGPTTHAFAFLGYPAIVKATTLLVAKSSVRVFIPVVLHFGELRHTGILDPDPVDDVENPIVLLPAMTMPGGSSYSGMVIPLTPTRRRRVLERLGDTSTSKTSETCDFASTLKGALARQGGMKELSEQTWKKLSGDSDEPRRRRRATRSSRHI